MMTAHSCFPVLSDLLSYILFLFLRLNLFRRGLNGSGGSKFGYSGLYGGFTDRLRLLQGGINRQTSLFTNGRFSKGGLIL